MIINYKLIYFNQNKLTNYLKNDYILSNVKKKQSHISFYDQWITDSPAKRMIYHWLVKELIKYKNKRLFDVGGGLHYFTNFFARNFKYSLIDPLYGLEKEKIDFYFKSSSKFNLIKKDWTSFERKMTDVVISNDLFPNTDQRIEEFIKFSSKICKVLFLILTFHNKTKSYLVKRLDTDEHLWIKQFDGYLLSKILRKNGIKLSYHHEKKIQTINERIFPNNRQVILLKLFFK